MKINQKNLTLISIIIPTYNHSQYLQRALNSLIEQTYENWEAIIVDNYSTDETEDIVKKLNEKRIRYIKYRNDGIIAKGRNEGIRCAKGEWVAFLDSDDWWHANKLNDFLLKEADSKFDFYYHELEVVGRNKGWRRNRIGSRKLKSPVMEDLLMGGNAIATSSVIVRSKILAEIRGFDESKLMVGCEDYNLWMRIGEKTERFFYCPKILGYYSVHDNNNSKKDLSGAEKAAIAPFYERMSTKQRKNLNTRIKYRKLRSAYLDKNYGYTIKNSLEIIINGTFVLRCKAAAHLLLSSAKCTLVKWIDNADKTN